MAPHGACGAHVPGPPHNPVPRAADPESAKGDPHLRNAGKRIKPQLASENALSKKVRPFARGSNAKMGCGTHSLTNRRSDLPRHGPDGFHRTLRSPVPDPGLQLLYPLEGFKPGARRPRP